MRNTDERIRAAHLGAKKYRKRQEKRQLQLATGGTAVLSLCLVIFLSVVIPPLMTEGDGTAMTTEFFGSIFTNSNAFSYIFIGILSFGLGVFVTVLCVLLHRKGASQEDDD